MPIPQRGFHPTFPPGSLSRDNDKSQSQDDHLSSSRSRRLVSGYLFGNPPSPVGQSPTRATSHDRNPTPPNGGADSPPLSDIHGEEPFKPLHEKMEALDIGETPKRTGTNSLTRKISSKSRDREIGYDALTGLNDGEADLDERAPPPDEWGTEEYLRGEVGTNYRFPKHRLRTRMKGESSGVRRDQCSS